MADQKVKDVLDRLWVLHQAKDADYSMGDPLSNFTACERFGVPAWKGALIRMSDKWSRLMSLVSKASPAVVNESIEDTLEDLALYAVITRVLREPDTKPPPPCPSNVPEKRSTPFSGPERR